MKKNYLIIGASSGIGESLYELMMPDANVFGTSRNINTSSNFYTINVLDEQLDFSFLPETLHGVVYLPGAIHLKPFARIKSEEFVADYQLQVLGAIKVIQTILPNLKQAEQASIVLFSTIAVQTGFNFHSLVASSKGALEGLTKSLAAELAPKIRVNCIAPSITQTPLAESLLNTPEKVESNAQRHPLKKIGTSNDVAQLASFLLQEKSSWITGQIFHIDGGLSTIKMI
jgi:NAD(P)-dependent dehydrogenase (short-subunit alcohol dehydrogenase family)